MAILGLDTVPKQSIFIGYMGLWCALRLFVYGSKNWAAAPKYNAVSLMIFTSFCKLAIATTMYVRADGSFSKLVETFRSNLPTFRRYAIPAGCYVVYDLLTFVNLSIFDPVTYSILMQLRLVATGVLWSIAFGRKLEKNQWIALAIITFGCMVKEGGKLFDSSKSSESHFRLYGLATIGAQVTFGVLASVANEDMLKKQASIPVNLQNIFMYTQSIMLNCVVLLVKGELIIAVQPSNLSMILSPYVLPIGLIMASIGIVTGWFLKILDSIRKSIASALEIFVDALLTQLIFGIPCGFATILASCLVSGGLYLYSKPSRPVEPEEPELDVEVQGQRGTLEQLKGPSRSSSSNSTNNAI